MPESLSPDRLLARALAGTAPAWPVAWQAPAATDRLLARIAYHGIGGLLFEQRSVLPGWPTAVLDNLREQAIARTMWEMRHRLLLATLLERFAAAGIPSLILKGSALAYDLYPSPASRVRGDTDLLIDRADLQPAREALAGLGYRLLGDAAPGLDDLNLQEVWQLRSADGGSHDLDLHWQALNSPALRDQLPFHECIAAARPLPRLHPAARGLDRARALLHACLHRAQHISSPYHVEGDTHYGGDRLIWAHDIHLLAAALEPEQWQQLCRIARAEGSAAACLAGLEFARARLGTAWPEEVTAQLRAAGTQAASRYLLGGRQVQRALLDLRAIPGSRLKLRYLGLRLFPSAAFLRDKYPRMQRAPLWLLHLRRLLDFFRHRAQGADR